MRNEVIVMGTIHSQHLTNADYGLNELSAIIKTIRPEIILAEIPPDRFVIAKKTFDKTGRITEPRVLQYPEFSQVVFPLQHNMGFDLFPVSAWTAQMAEAREQKLEELSIDPKREADWNTYLDARQETARLFEKADRGFDPAWIHSSEFDSIMNVELQVFDDLFNDDLQLGGWSNINEAHYKLISEQLHAFKDQNKRILIMFGAGHKGWLINRLSKRDDIKLRNLLEVL